MNRSEVFNKLSHDFFDLLILGGGITGAGIALDAASRGLKVALIEQQDFAGGTSSRSTKLIHGGLRYLKQGDIALVREVGRERAVLHKNAPHLVIPEKMLMPLIKGGQNGSFLTSIGLRIYDWLAKVPKAERRVMMDADKTLENEPLLNHSNVLGGAMFYEYRTDDARLTIEVLKTAEKYGATCINYVKSTQLLYKSKSIEGTIAKDMVSGEAFEIRARYVVNATGAWVDELRKSDQSFSGKKLHLTKGVHLVVPFEKLPVKQSIYFDVAGGRMIFAIPRGKTTYFGTTDTNYSGDKEKPLVTIEDATYLINAVNETFPAVHIRLEDIISSWAGLRPLIHQEGKSSTELSRKDEIFVSHTGLISIAGGKLTGYRKMAQRVVDRFSSQPCLTEGIKLTETKEADLKYCIEHEWVENLMDYTIRRTGMLYFEPDKMNASMDMLLDKITDLKHWGPLRKEEERTALKEALFNAQNFKS